MWKEFKMKSTGQLDEVEAKIVHFNKKTYTFITVQDIFSDTSQKVL